jgi:nitrile hydratase beta subunit
MKGGQDLGGMMGFGAIEREENEPPFHSEWERRLFALTLAASAPGQWNIDMGRFARESLPPPQYLNSSYFEIWLAGLETLLAERGLVTSEELERGEVLETPIPDLPTLKKENVVAVLEAGGPADRPPLADAAYSIGSAVRVRNLHSTTHTRMPSYVRGHCGEIKALRGVHVFPDTNALGEGECPTWLYSVEFSGRELWGDTGPGEQAVMVDLWEPYLEPA